MAIKKRFTYPRKEKIYTSDYLSLLQAYEDTGLTPEDIEQLKEGKTVDVVPEGKVAPLRKGRPPKTEERYVLPKWFQEALRKRRQNNRVSIAGLASAVRVSHGTVQQMEVKDGFSARKSVVQAICSLLKMEWAWDKLQKEVRENEA